MFLPDFTDTFILNYLYPSVSKLIAFQIVFSFKYILLKKKNDQIQFFKYMAGKG